MVAVRTWMTNEAIACWIVGSTKKEERIIEVTYEHTIWTKKRSKNLAIEWISLTAILRSIRCPKCCCGKEERHIERD